MSGLAPRYGLRLTCQTCRTRTTAGGYTDPTKRDALETAQMAKHLAAFPSHTLVVTRDSHAAELQHIFQEVPDQRTDTVATGNNFYDITDAVLSNTSFTAGKKYLLVVSSQIGGATINTTVTARTVHGSTPFDDSVWGMEPQQSTTGKWHYVWWTVWEAVAGEDIKVQFGGTVANRTVNADFTTLTAIKLSDDLVENTDWKVHEPAAASTSLTTTDSSSNNATVSITPAVANDDWLVLSKARFTTTSTSSNVYSRIVRSGEASSTLPTAGQEGESPTAGFDQYIFTLARVYTLGAA
jgi:hypothetical protein